MGIQKQSSDYIHYPDFSQIRKVFRKTYEQAGSNYMHFNEIQNQKARSYSQYLQCSHLNMRSAQFTFIDI